MVYIIKRKILRPTGIFLLINIFIIGRRIIDNPQFIRIFYNLKRLALLKLLLCLQQLGLLSAFRLICRSTRPVCVFSQYTFFFTTIS